MICYVHPALKAEIEAAADNATLARCGLLFVSQLYLKGAEKHDFAHFTPLHSRVSRKIYTTRFYGPMLALLRRVKAVQLQDGGGYAPGNVSKRYRLTNRYRSGVQAWPIDCSRLEARFDRAMTSASYAAMTGGARRWIVKSYLRATFPPTVAELLRVHPFKSEEARVCAEHHVDNILAGRLRFKVCRKSGRVYYPVANLPKVFRASLQLAGDAVAEIDIAASQPTLLATLYSRPSPERDAFLAFVQGGRFYETIAEWANCGWCRDEAKTAFFNQIAFGSFFCAEKYPLLPQFAERFPQLMEAMTVFKRLGNAVLPLRLQKLEANITIAGACGECAARQIWILPVHDSLICRRADQKAVGAIFARHWEQRTKIPARLKIH